MKQIFYTILALSVLLFTGCDNLLDKQPLDKFTDSNFWTSETNVEAFANRFYDNFSGYANSGDFYFRTLNDNQASSGFTEWNFKQVPASSSLWNNCYEEIRRANLMIARIPDIAAMTDAQKNHWIGVARLFRALNHFQLVRAFGDIIYVDKVLDVTDEDKENYLYGAREDRDAVMDKVLEDINFAVANITKNAESRVFINAAVAQAMKSDICLFEGTFCKYRSTADGQKAPDAARANKFLTEAKTAAKAVMDNNMYVLNDSYKANYDSEDLSKNKEMILYKKYEYGVMGHSLISFTCSSTMQSGLTKSAFDSYLFIDGKPLALTSQPKTDHPVMSAAGNLNITNLLNVRDPRLAAHIDTVLMYRGNDFLRFNTGTMTTTSSTGYGVCKFDSEKLPSIRRFDNGANDTDAPVYWLAPVYLNYAEACAELGSCTQNDLNISVNKLRARVGMPHMPVNPAADPANNMGVSALIWEIRRERRVELMFDNNDRYWGLIRWHQLDKLDISKYPDQMKGAYVKGDPVAGTKDCVPITSDGYADANAAGKSRTFEARQYLYPIPSGQIDLYKAAGKTLTQNPGW